MGQRKQIKNCQRWVIKVGSSLVTSAGRGLDQTAIAQWVEQIAQLHKSGMQVILVSSGAVAEGMMRLGWGKRPHAVNELQAAAAVGQMGLVQAYESCFLKHGIHTAQILLTHDDLSDRQRYLNARSTLRALLELKIVPVVNENDTVTTDEIRFGDNDSLAALVANLVEADALLLLTDQSGLFDKDPRHHDDARLIDQANANDGHLDGMVNGRPGMLGRGGMLTKVRAARLAARSGALTVITDGSAGDVISRVVDGEPLGTLLEPDEAPLAARKQWLAGHLQTQGKLVLDAGAVKVLKNSGSSLLAVGVTAVQGNFSRGELVACVDPHGVEVARGLVNYNATEAGQIIGQTSAKIENILGYVDEPELIHRDNLVLL